MKSEFYSRYYDKTFDDVPFAVKSLGFNHCASGYRFSEMLKKHPESYRSVGKSGRVLDSLVLSHVTRGRGRFVSNVSGVLEIPKNSITIIFPGVRHSFRYDIMAGWDGEWVEIAADAALPILYKNGISPKSPSRSFKALPELTLRFHELFAVSRLGGALSNLACAAAAYRVFAEIMAVWPYGTSGTDCRHESGMIEEFSRHLDVSYDSSMNVAAAARAVGASETHLRRLFKVQMGMSPKKYQMKKRIDKACQMLMTTKMNLSEIGAACGFDSLYAFSRQFRRSTGLTATDYRLAHSRK